MDHTPLGLIAPGHMSEDYVASRSQASTVGTRWFQAQDKQMLLHWAGESPRQFSKWSLGNPWGLQGQNIIFHNNCLLFKNLILS